MEGKEEELVIIRTLTQTNLEQCLLALAGCFSEYLPHLVTSVSFESSAVDKTGGDSANISVLGMGSGSTSALRGTTEGIEEEEEEAEGEATYSAVVSNTSASTGVESSAVNTNNGRNESKEQTVPPLSRSHIKSLLNPTMKQSDLSMHELNVLYNNLETFIDTVRETRGSKVHYFYLIFDSFYCFCDFCCFMT